MVVDFFFSRGHIDQLKLVYENYSSHHHRSLASTLGSVLGFGGRGRWFKAKKIRKKIVCAGLQSERLLAQLRERTLQGKTMNENISW